MHRIFDNYVLKDSFVLRARRCRPVCRGFIALGIMGAALVLRWLIAPIDAGIQYVTIFPAIALCALMTGLWPSLIASCLGLTAATYFFWPPYASFTFQAGSNVYLSNGVVALDAFIVTTIIETLFHQYARLDASDNELRLLAATFQTQQGILITDPTGVILRVNDEFCRNTGYAAAEVIGKRPSLLKSGRHDEEFYRQMWRQITTEGVWSGEVWDRRKDGTLFPKLLTITAIKNRAGQTIYYVGTHTDISEKKQVEEQLAAYRENLETEVALRTGELARAKDLAEVANRAKTLFLGNMSHEMRTPLHQIGGAATLFARSEVSDKQRRWLELIGAGVKRLEAIISSILTLVDIESGTEGVHYAPVRLDQVFAEVLAAQGEAARQKGLALVTEFAEFPDTLLGDPRLMGNLLNAFLSNAIKFSSRGTVTVRFLRAAEDAGSMVLRIEVGDQGIGIDKAHLERIFDDFEQADNSTTRQYGGVGVGLAVAKRLARMAGGEVGCASVPGEGSVFWATVCLVKKQQGEVAVSATPL